MSLIYVIITAILFATLEPVSKLIATDISPLAITAIRFLIGGLMLLPFSLYEIKKQKVRLKPTDHLKMTGLGILFICASMVMLQYAIKLSSSPALVAIVFSSNSVITICLSALMLKERLDWKKVVALVLCVGGILVCSWDSLSVDNEALSIILAVLASLAFSFYTVLNKKMMKKASGNILIGFSFVYGSVILLLVNWMIGQPILTLEAGETLSLQSILILLFIGVAVTGVGYWSYFKALEKGSATLASLSFFVKPVLSPFVAYFVNDVDITIETMIALVMVLAGSYMVSYADKKRVKE